MELELDKEVKQVGRKDNEFEALVGDRWNGGLEQGPGARWPLPCPSTTTLGPGNYT